MYRFAALSVWLLLIVSFAGCGDPGHPYFPAGDDRSWIYEVRVRNWRDVNVQHSREVVRGLPDTRSEGRRLIRRWRHDNSVALYWNSDRGLFHVGTVPNSSSRKPTYIQPREQLVLPAPLAVGRTWVRHGTTFLVPIFACGYCTTTAPIAAVVPVKYELVSTADTVTVPAGVFERCIHIRGHGKVHVDSGTGTGWIDLSVDTDEWYAPGIGLVKSRWHEVPHTRMLSDGEFIMELTDFLPGRG